MGQILLRPKHLTTTSRERGERINMFTCPMCHKELREVWEGQECIETWYVVGVDKEGYPKYGEHSEAEGMGDLTYICPECSEEFG